VAALALSTSSCTAVLGLSGYTYDDPRNEEGRVRWVQAFGGTGFDASLRIAVDPAGMVYVAGCVGIADGNPDSDCSNQPISFLRATDTAGALAWQQFYGQADQGGSLNRPTALILRDADVLIGGFFAHNFQADPSHLAQDGTDEAFLISASKTSGAVGTLKSYGDMAANQAIWRGVGLGKGAALIGDFGGTIDFGSGAATAEGAYDSFVLELGADLTPKPPIILAGGGNVFTRGIAVMSDGAAVIGGEFSGEAKLLNGAPLTATGPLDGYLMRTGKTPWVRTFASMGGVSLNNVAIDAFDNVYVAVSFSGSVTFAKTPLMSAGQADGVVAKFGPDGKPIWAVQVGSIGNDALLDLAVDSVGDVVAVGAFEGTVLVGGVPVVSHGGPDALVVKIEGETGKVDWARSFGGPAREVAMVLAIGPDDSIYVGGSLQNDAQFDDQVLSASGPSDAFLMSLTK
jgi:hypothetical protein